MGLGLTHNPISAIREPSPGKKRDPRLNVNEERCLLESVRQHSNPMLSWVVRLVIETGMRQSEILNLRFSDVDLRSQVARLSDTKNNSARTVLLTEDATAVLKEAVYNPLRPPNTDLVFFGEPGSDGKRRRYQFAKIWGDIKATLAITDLHFHDLRHEAVSRLVKGGLVDQEAAWITRFQLEELLELGSAEE